jgi:ATP-dependent DNA helicase RecQ
MKDQAIQFLRTSLENPDADFRSGQWDAIEGVLNGRKQLVVQRTGWGKSLVYFIATRLLRERGKGPTLLVSPLLSLMRNQVEAGKRLGLKIAAIDYMNKGDWEQIENDLLSNRIDLLMISPERLSNEGFRQRVLQPIANSIALFVVDEAHCISDWGHDFRPDYRRIVRVLQALPSNLPVLATTATANDRVVNDVRNQLGKGLEVVRGPLVRKSLRLQNVELPNPIDRYAGIVQLLRQLDGSGIIYTLTVRDAIRLSAWLQSQGVDAHAYYSDLDKKDKTLRSQLEQKLLNNEIKALVSTVALGMGFDKPDLTFVIHFQRPSSVVLYYQQVGRAGRAVDEAYGILMGGSEDDDIADYFIRSAFPPQAHVSEVLHALREADNGLSTNEMEPVLNLSYSKIKDTLNFLSVEEPAPVAKSGSKWSATPYSISYQINEDRLAEITALRRHEQKEMQSYMQHQGCLMRFLSDALDDPQAADCGQCAACQGNDLHQVNLDPDLQQQAADFLRRTYQTIEPRKQKPTGDYQVFAEMGPGKRNIPNELRCEEGKALSIWGDPGWGQLVRSGKYPHPGMEPHFDDRLVEACAEMLTQWQPQPAPVWVTSIPSLRHPDLVPNFAQRLAAHLGLPYMEALVKTQHTERQRDMENSAYQVANLDGSISVTTEELPTGPVLLVDDMSDSRWTFAIAGYLLRGSGVESVHPLALALNSISNS